MAELIKTDKENTDIYLEKLYLELDRLKNFTEVLLKLSKVNSNTIVLEESFGSKAKTKLFKMDDNAFSTIKSWLKQGRLPEDGEIIISNDMAREIGKTVGDSIKFGGNTYNIAGIIMIQLMNIKNFTIYF